MKTLHESILSTTKAGKYGRADKVKEWFIQYNNQSTNLKVSGPEDVEVIDHNGEAYTIVIHNHGRRAAIYGFDGKEIGMMGAQKGPHGLYMMPYNIQEIYYKDTPADIYYTGLEFKTYSAKKSPIDYSVTSVYVFYDCFIDEINSLPQHVKSVTLVRCKTGTVKDLNLVHLGIVLHRYSNDLSQFPKNMQNNKIMELRIRGNFCIVLGLNDNYLSRSYKNRGKYLYINDKATDFIKDIRKRNKIGDIVVSDANDKIRYDEVRKKYYLS